jgi:inhibitor of KinA sporulation pathway (predicted exonuclease)
MNYIVFDLEFNQDFSIAGSRRALHCCFEIIQIGAVKLDENLNTVDTFRRNVRPTIYPVVNPFISELTGLTTEQLVSEEEFPIVYKSFAEFSGGCESIFCSWGIVDMKELFRNIEYHKLDLNLVSKRHINLQPYASNHFNLSQKKMMKLKTAAELLGIPLVYSFHDALHDAYYTAEILKQIINDSIRPKRYDPEQTAAFSRPSQCRGRPRQKTDYHKLLLQFEKMYSREMTEEEKSMIILAYKMGKTRQFLI